MNKLKLALICTFGTICFILLGILAFKLTFSFFPYFAMPFWDILSFVATPLLH